MATVFGFLSNKRIPHHDQHYITRELGIPTNINEPIWQLHYILFGVLFTLISCFILMSILGLIQDDRQKKFQRRHYFLWMNIALFYFSVTMAIALLADPYEDRRYIKSMTAREGLHLIIRLRLPCLGFAFSMLQLSLFNVTEVVLYATWYHKLAIILIINAVHFGLVIVASVSSMCVQNEMVVWLVCDLFMFLLFSSNSLVSLYSVVRILRFYHRNDTSRCRSVSKTNCMCPRRTTFGEEDYIDENDIKIETKKSSELGDENSAYHSENENDENESNSTEATDVTVASEMSDESNYTHYNNKNHEGGKNKFTDKNTYRTNSKLSSGSTKSKVTCQKRRIGSRAHQIHSSKFSDKSIRKVAILMMVVAVFGLLMCVTIVISISSAEAFQGDHLQPWEWFSLRTVRRVTEVWVTGTMAYLIRRTFSCC